MKLALGSVQFGVDYGIANAGGRVTFDEARAIIRRAEACGIRTIDTAIGYGSSEERLGRIGIDGWTIVTKLGEYPADAGPADAWAQSAIDGSLERLHQPAVYAVLLHRPMQLLGPQGAELYDALVGIKQSGRAARIGYSLYEPQELDRLYPRFPCDIVQIPCNVLDRRFERSGWLARLVADGVEVHARSAFLQGLLVMPAAARPQYFEPWHGVLAAFDSWVERSGVSAVAACLRHVLAIREIDHVVVGVDRVRQLEEIVEAARGTSVGAPDDLFSDDPALLNPSHWQSAMSAQGRT